MTEPTTDATGQPVGTARERVENALRFARYLMQAIDAPKDIESWPRKDRDAWIEVVGRERIQRWMLEQRQSSCQHGALWQNDDATEWTCQLCGKVLDALPEGEWTKQGQLSKEEPSASEAE